LPSSPFPEGASASLFGHRLIDWLPAVIVLVGIVGLWQGLIVWLDVQQFLLPKPTAIASAFWTDSRSCCTPVGTRSRRRWAGSPLGSGTAILVALVLADGARSERADALLHRRECDPDHCLCTDHQPVVHGGLTKSSKVVIAAILCFFPVLVNTLRGLTSVRPQDLELMRSYAGGQTAIFRRVRIPNALPFMFTGLKVATVLAMIGAIVGEYFGGALNALGVLILARSRIFLFTQAWAGVFVACLFGLGLYLAVALVERVVLRWMPSTWSDNKSESPKPHGGKGTG